MDSHGLALVHLPNKLTAPRFRGHTARGQGTSPGQPRPQARGLAYRGVYPKSKPPRLDMNDSQAMSTLRDQVLNKLAGVYPVPLTVKDLEAKCRMPFLTKDEQWYKDSMKEQLSVLLIAGLIRPFNKGYALTERGRTDRNQAARFNPPTPPTEAA